MPRVPRKRSHSGIYHIMLCGTDKQRIFHDAEDSATFLQGLRKYRELCQSRNIVIRPLVLQGREHAGRRLRGCHGGSEPSALHTEAAQNHQRA